MNEETAGSDSNPNRYPTPLPIVYHIYTKTINRKSHTKLNSIDLPASVMLHYEHTLLIAYLYEEHYEKQKNKDISPDHHCDNDR